MCCTFDSSAFPSTQESARTRSPCSAERGRRAHPTHNRCNQFHRLGVRIAMDDFGTGYSSLSYLQKFPFDKIKIDGSFIKGLSDSDGSAAIVRAVAGLATSFRLTTTAEGVETAAQLHLVKELGCTEMQGHLFAKACNAADLAKLMEAHDESFRPSRSENGNASDGSEPHALTYHAGSYG
jgi:EAL domain-containing protein (putative c-di-GMP-specific phosphodiesterase class I)